MQAAAEKSAQDRERVTRILQALKVARKVAILRLGSVGDVLATLPFAWLLREILPESARIVWIAHPAEAKLFPTKGAQDSLFLLPLLALLTGSWLERKLLDRVKPW